MEFVCYHRDRPGSRALREELVEAHRSYMDRYATDPSARGPVSSGDPLAGSAHVVDLPGAADARAFAFDEPDYRAGAYRDVLLRRWGDTLGRTRWEFPGRGRDDGDRYLGLGLGSGETTDLAVPSGRDHGSGGYGPLPSDDGAARLGTAALVRAPDRSAHRAVVRRHRGRPMGARGPPLSVGVPELDDPGRRRRSRPPRR